MVAGRMLVSALKEATQWSVPVEVVGWPSDVAVSVLPLMLSVSVSVTRRLPLSLHDALPIYVTVSVLLGLTRPLTVALSAMEAPTVALAGCCMVLMFGPVGVVRAGV